MKVGTFGIGRRPLDLDSYFRCHQPLKTETNPQAVVEQDAGYSLHFRCFEFAHEQTGNWTADVDCRACDYERLVNLSQPYPNELLLVLAAASKSSRNVSLAPGVSILTVSPPPWSRLGDH